MNDAERIDEKATIDARDDFEALNEWLEEMKKKVQDFQIDKPHLIYTGSSLFFLGMFLGSKSNPKLRWLISFLSGAGFSYSALQVILQLRKEKKEAQISDETKSDPKDPKRELKNIKVLNE